MEIVEVLKQVVTVERDRDDEILGFDFVFVDQNNTDFNVIFCYYQTFSKSQFSGTQLTYIKLWVAICILVCVM